MKDDMQARNGTADSPSIGCGRALSVLSHVVLA